MSYSVIPPMSVLCPDGILLTFSHDGDLEIDMEGPNFTADAILDDEAAGTLHQWLTDYLTRIRRDGESKS